MVRRPVGRKRRQGWRRKNRKTELNPDDALRIIKELKEQGLINFNVVKSGKETVDFVKFLKKFWDFTALPYIRKNLAHGQSSVRTRCIMCLRCFSLTIKPFGAIF